MRGFSLVELSIVLVILGLLTGGVLAGRSLIRAAELRSITTDVPRYNAAMYAFRDKYFELPGDMPNAVRFWGAQAGPVADGPQADCNNLTHLDPATDARTCNGNGDRQLTWQEAWRAWQQLANAGLVEGAYTGVPATSDPAFGAAGQNMPTSKAAKGTGFAYGWIGSVDSSSTWFFPGAYGNAMYWGGGQGVDEGNRLLADEAWNIDMKMDDGLPGQGKMRSYMASRRACATSDDAADARYWLGRTPGDCNLLFIPGF